jgi:hypothetical protein
MASRRTKYQRDHCPTSVVQVKCTSTELDAGGICTACGRWLKRRGPHNPNTNGALGWIENYADDSTFQVAPGGYVKRP